MNCNNRQSNHNHSSSAALIFSEDWNENRRDIRILLPHRPTIVMQSVGVNAGLRTCGQMQGNLKLYHVLGDFLRVLFAASHLLA